jgi:transcriptional regulator with XRE-family HTH domain
MRLSGARVREARKAVGVSRDELARRANVEGVDGATVAAIESQRVTECEDELGEALARALGVEPGSIESRDAAAAQGASQVSARESGEPRGPLERAMDAAFDPADHTAQDRFSVDAALRYIPVGFIAPREIVGVARAWLDAAAVLRSHGIVPTFTTLAHCVGALDGFAAEHARRLLAQAKEAGALEAEPGRDR